MKKRSVISAVLPVVLVMLSIGLISACKKSPKSTSNEQATTMNQSTAKPAVITFTADLSGANEVPSVTTTATGMLTARLEGDSIHVSGQFSGLSGTFTGSHIHMGAKGSNGSVVQPLVADINSDSTSGSWESSKNSYMLSQDQLTALKAGNLYVNVHTVTNKSGEIRGQLTATPDTSNSNPMNQ